MIIALKPTPIELLTVIFLPVSVILLTVNFGLAVNIRLHDFEWEKEVAVVKQSMPALIGGFSGLLLCLASAVIILALPDELQAAVKLILSAVFLLSAALIYQNNAKKELASL